MQGVGRLGVIVSYVSDVFAVSHGQVSAGLTDVGFFAGFTCQTIDSAFVMVRDCFVVFRSGLVLCRVCGSEGYLDVCVSEEVCNLSDCGAVVGEYGPFFVFVAVDLGCFVLDLLFHFFDEG